MKVVDRILSLAYIAMAFAVVFFAWDVFTTTDALCDHVESDCPVLNGDDFTAAADLKVVS